MEVGESGKKSDHGGQVAFSFFPIVTFLTGFLELDSLSLSPTSPWNKVGLEVGRRRGIMRWDRIC